MRMFAAWIMALGLAVAPVTAATGAAGDGDGARTSKANSSATANDKGDNTSSGSKADAPAKPEAARMESELHQLKQLIQSQAAALQEQQHRMEALEEELRAARSINSASAAPPAAPVGAGVASTPGTATQGYGNDQGEKKSPLSFKIGAADFTPGGFLDFTSIFRTTNVGSGIGTSFGSIPFSNTTAGALTESRFSPQNSRLSLKVDANVTESTHVTGYVETDFLGFQPANANQTSNSDSLRLRLYWADVKHGAWEVLGGQSWTLMTPNRVGLSPTPSEIFYSQDMDTNYQVGLTWARQPQFRVVYHPTNWWAFGVSIENPQQFAPSSVVFPNSTFAGQFDNGSGNTSSAAAVANTSVPNLHPDVIVKTAFDWKLVGKAMHVEAAGLVRSFKVFNNLTSPASTDTSTGGGGSLNMNLELIKNFHLIANSFYSCGGGRYIFGLGPDAIIKANGTLRCVHSGSGIGGFEWQQTPKFMTYGYYGGAYYQRTFDFIAAGTGSTPVGTPCKAAAPPAGFNCIGFGFPGSSNSANRAIQEATIGFIPTVWKNPNYGALQIITQYSYLTRAPWFVTTGAPKNAHASMVYLDLRYVLP
jgi:hypothetical protein